MRTFPRRKLKAEVAELSKKMEADWRSKADAKDWDSVAANLQVYAIAGQAVDSDPRRTPEYRAKVIGGLRLGPSENRPGITEADLAASNRWLAARPRHFGAKELPVLRSESLRTIACLYGASGQFPTARAPG